jgi:hypothetical protein
MQEVYGMRAVFFGALLAALAGSPAASGALPRIGDEPSCEDECKAQTARDDAVCDVGSLDDAERSFCHLLVRARYDVCLRICAD